MDSIAQDIAAYIAAETGQSYMSDWLEVDQAMIGQFADCTRDWNFLHVDPEAAGATEFGGTIAHGFLVLSLLAPLRTMTKVRAPFPHLRVGVNYGLESVRWVQPVRSGSRIRGHFVVSEIAEAGQGRWRETVDVRVEADGLDRPAMAAQWLTMYLT